MARDNSKVRPFRLFPLAFLVFSAFPIHFLIAASEAQNSRDTLSARTVNFSWENDQSHWSFRGTDRHYTNGIRLALVWSDAYPPFLAPKWLKKAGSGLPLFTALDDAKFNHSYGLSIGQNMYTPKNIATPDPDPTDRPYGGWLYMGIVAHGFEMKPTLKSKGKVLPASLKRVETIELDLGMVGKASLAGPTQRFIHRTIGATKPEGWDHQIKNEPGFLLLYDARWKSAEGFRAGQRWGDLATHVGGALGNVFTFARTSVTGRVGRSLSDDFGPGARIEAVEPQRERAPRRRNLEVYAFGRAEGRSVLRNIFLDGNTFRDSPRVEKRPFVADLEWGASLRYHRVRLSWRQVHRSSEFTGKRDREIFGSWSLALEPSHRGSG